MFPILPLLDLLAQEFEELSGALFSQGPDLEGRRGGRRRLQHFSPAGRKQEAVQGSGDPQEKQRGACDLKPGMAEDGKTRYDQSCNDLPFATLGAHRHAGGGLIGQFLQSVFITVEKEKGSVRSVDGSQAEEPALGGKEAYEFLLALSQHRAGHLGMGADGVMLELDAFALPSASPDKGATQFQHLPLALFGKGPLGYIASRPFFPERNDVLSQLLDRLLIHLPDNDPARGFLRAGPGSG